MALTSQTKNCLRAALAETAAASEVIANLEAVEGISAAELAFIDGVTAGTVAASKAVVVDASKDVAGIRNLTLGTAASTLGTLVLSGNTAGTVTVKTAATAGDWSLTLPADDGDAGEQLQTNGSGVSTWEAAGSMSAVKNILGSLDAKAHEALERIMTRSVYAFNYKPNARQETGLPALSDTQTEFHGILAEEYPEVMMWGGKIFCPISAFGEAMLAIKALAEEVTSLKAQLAS
jgi:hypothetical protein